MDGSGGREAHRAPVWLPGVVGYWVKKNIREKIILYGSPIGAG